jgi:bacillithiol system protein YtxJ
MMKLPQITDAAGLEEAMGRSPFLLLKHSLRCPISSWAFEEFHRFAEEHPTIPAAWVDVIASRPLSLALAEETGISHASPQAFLIVDGEVAWSATHSRITYESLERATTLKPSTPPGSGSPGS